MVYLEAGSGKRDETERGELSVTRRQRRGVKLIKVTLPADRGSQLVNNNSSKESKGK